MTRWFKVAGIVLLLAVGVATYFYVRGWLDDRREADERIIQLEASIATLRQNIAEEEAKYRREHEEWQQRRTQDSTTIATLTEDVEEAKEEGERQAAELRARLPIQFRAEFDALITQHRREVAAILAREAEKDRIIERQDQRIAKMNADFERINGQLHEAVAQALDLADQWERKSKRAIWEKAIFTVPVTVATTILLTNALTK